MKIVIFEDKQGKLHRAMLRDNDPEALANEGIPIDPPNIDDVLEEAKIELHNELVRRELVDLKSINNRRGALASAVNKHITRKILKLYLHKEEQNKRKKE